MALKHLAKLVVIAVAILIENNDASLVINATEQCKNGQCYKILFESNGVRAEFNVDEILENETYITFIESKFKRIPKNLFTVFPQVKSLNIRNVDLSEVTSDDFENADNLDELSLTGNQLKTLNDKVFSQAGNLTELQIISNQISELQPDAFYGLEKLLSLSLVSNKISYLPSSIFVPLTSLKSLDLRLNQLEFIGDEIFLSNFQLNHLSLSNNPIKIFGDFAVRHLDLKLLSLERSFIQEIHLGSVKRLILNDGIFQIIFIHGKCEEITAKNNQISRIYSGDWSALKKLQIQNNSIGDLEQFSQAVNLEALNISGNSIQLNPELNFNSYRKLKSLSLAGMDLHELKETHLSGLENLEILDLINCYLNDVDPNILFVLKRLQILILPKNLSPERTEEFRSIARQIRNDRLAGVGRT